MRFEQKLKHFCNEKDFSKRLEFYKSIEENETLLFSHDGELSETVMKYLSCLLSYLLADFTESKDETHHIFLNVVNRLHTYVDPELSVDDDVAVEFLKKLFSILSSSKSSLVIQKATNLLGLQRFSEKVLSEVIEIFFESIPATNTVSDGAIINVLNRFIQQCPKTMESNIEPWLKLLLRFTCHSDVYVREQSVSALKENLSIILLNKKKILAVCGGFLKEDVLPNLSALCAKEDVLYEILSVQLPVYMAIIGEDYRRSSRLSNSILKFVEKGFCHSDEKIKISAFSAWNCLIDCFAGNKDLLASTKYFRLFTQPLKLKLKTETLIKALVQTMWKLAVHLDNSLPDLFEMLCVPLFGICFHGTARVMQARRSGGRWSLSSTVPCENIQILGAEILSHLLLSPTAQEHAFSLDPLREPYFATPTVFARFHDTLIQTVSDTICQLHHLLSTSFLWNIWFVSLSCVKTNLTKKRDGVDMFKNLYQSAFRIAEANLNEDLLLSIVSSLTTFPNKILNSSLHHHSDSTLGSMHGTPVDSVARLLFSPNVSRNNVQKPKFLQCAQTVIACGMERRIGNLEFIQSTVGQLNHSDEVFLDIWTYLCDQIATYLDENGNVNDGDSLEHDFSSLYDTLLYPFHFVFDADAKLSIQASKPARHSWSQLFARFASLTSAIASTRPNEARLFVASRVLEKLQATKSSKLQPSQLYFLEVILFEIVNGADFSLQQVDDQTIRSKCKKKPAKYTDSLSDFSKMTMKLLSSLEIIFVDPHTSFPPFNILSSVHVIISSVSLPLVAPFFTQCSCILFEYIRNFSTLSGDLASTLERTWNQILLRLPFSQVLFHCESIVELFSLVLSNVDSSLYKHTVDFWEMKVLDVFDPLKVPDDFLLVISEMYENEGFPIKWNDEKKVLDLNDSTTSDRSYGETDLCDTIVSESDVSVRDASESDVSVRDAVSSDDDMTQLDMQPCSASDDSNDFPENRSLNLRTLACGVAIGSSKNGKSSKNDCDPENDEVIVHETSSDRSVEVRTPSPSCIVITDSDDEKTSSTESRAAKCEIDSSNVLLDSIIDKPSLETSSVSVTSSNDDNLRSSLVNCDDSAELVEMAHVSVNVDLDDVTIKSSQEDFKRFSKPKSGPFPVVQNKPTSKKRNDSDFTENTFDDDSCLETVEMVEMSVMHDAGTNVNETLDNKHVRQDDGSIDKKQLEGSVYEYVEMVDISVHPCDSSILPSSKSITPKKSKQITPIKTLQVAVDNARKSPCINGDSSPLSEADSSVYETVEMKEISVNPNYELTNEFSILETDEVSVNDVNRSSKPMQSVKVASKPVLSPVEPVTSESQTMDLKKTSDCEVNSIEIPPESALSNVESPTFSCLATVPNDRKKTLDCGFGAACADDLGVKPLDSSFEGCESVENSPAKDQPSSTKIEDMDSNVITDSLPLVEDETKSSFSNKKRKSKKTKRESSNTKLELKKKKRRKKTSTTGLESSDASTTQSTVGDISNPFAVVVVLNESKDHSAADVTNISRDLTDRSMTSSTTTDPADTSVDEKAAENNHPRPHDNAIGSQASAITSPQASDKEPDDVETPRSCLGKRTTALREGTDASPSESPCGILKKRVSDYLSPVAKARRVSFAEPISVSSDSPQHPVYHSPFSSPRHFKKHHVSNRLVSRRLSLPVPHRSYEAASPVSVRSASIAAAIADIKAKNGGDTPNSTPSKTFSYDISSVCAAQLKDISFLKSLSIHQLEKVADIIHQAAPLVHSVLINKLKNQNR